jgi:hypothetical protein
VPNIKCGPRVFAWTLPGATRILDIVERHSEGERAAARMMALASGLDPAVRVGLRVKPNGAGIVEALMGDSPPATLIDVDAAAHVALAHVSVWYQEATRSARGNSGLRPVEKVDPGAPIPTTPEATAGCSAAGSPSAGSTESVPTA